MYSQVKIVESLQESLNNKYKTKETDMKKFVIDWFLDYKMMDSNYKFKVNKFMDFKMVESKSLMS
ncbi:hypothetical protein SADUNF_Sadunf16G0252300 [Salix dunnii]|uniref:Uncharacterized protein n=1 Tax=Salix dunnii TaxID=1413687 RepID=A0A835MK02_9ROSI|nr:hypothetical protein SADUNF_Sadunf16G0252300 [Salix dunnii]